MDAQPFIDIVLKEWEAVRQAPVVFSVALVPVITVTWAVINFLYISRISSLEERLRLKQDQVDDYKYKLKGASPEEAKARLDPLEAQLKILRNDLNALGEVDLVKKFEEALKTADIVIDGGTF